MKTKNLFYSIFFVLSFILVNIPLIKALLLPRIISIIFFVSVALGLLYFSFSKTERIHFLLQILCFCLILNLFFIVGWLETPWNIPVFQHKELCLQYLSEGTLYEGQPYCAQGPVFYLIEKLVQLLPGNNQLNNDIYFQSSAVFFLFIVFVTLYLLKKKMTNDTSFLFLEIFFILYFIRIAEDDMTSLVAVTFLLLGLYFLYVSSTKYKQIYAAIFFGFSLFSKAHFILAVVPIIFFYTLHLTQNDTLKNTYHPKRWRFILNSLATFFIPLLFLFFIFKIAFPQFLSYYYFAQFAQHHALSFTEALSYLFTFQYIHNGFFFLFYLCFFISILRIFHNKAVDLFSFICSFIFFFIITKMLQVHGIANITESYKYLFMIMPFFVINLYFFNNEFPQFNKKLKFFTASVLLIFIFIFYQMLGGITFGDVLDESIFHEQKLIKKLQREMSYPLLEIQKPVFGKILVFENYTSFFGNKAQNPFFYLEETDFENLEFRDPYPERPDIPYAESLVKIGIVESLDQYSPTVQINLTETVEKMYNLSYPIIIEGMQYRSSKEVLYQNTAFFQKTYPCSAVLGILSGGYSLDPELPHILLLDFIAQEDCDRMATKIYYYYTQNFDYLCTRGSYNSIVIKEVFQENGFPTLTESCKTLHRTTDFIVAAHYKAAYLGFFILLFLGWIVVRRE